MDLKPKLTSHQILAKKFTPDVKGYQPEEVDRFLDEILDDYHVMEAFLKNEYQTLAALQITEGAKVKVSSATGTIELEAAADDRLANSTVRIAQGFEATVALGQAFGQLTVERI